MSAGMAIAAVSTIGYLGFLFGPPVIGYIAKTANLRYSFALIAVFGFCVIILASKVKVNKQ
jgi:MFS family permease